MSLHGITVATFPEVRLGAEKPFGGISYKPVMKRLLWASSPQALQSLEQAFRTLTMTSHMPLERCAVFGLFLRAGIEWPVAILTTGLSTNPTQGPGWRGRNSAVMSETFIESLYHPSEKENETAELVRGILIEWVFDTLQVPWDQISSSMRRTLKIPMALLDDTGKRRSARRPSERTLNQASEFAKIRSSSGSARNNAEVLMLEQTAAYASGLRLDGVSCSAVEVSKNHQVTGRIDLLDPWSGFHLTMAIDAVARTHWSVFMNNHVHNPRFWDIMMPVPPIATSTKGPLEALLEAGLFIEEGSEEAFLDQCVISGERTADDTAFRLLGTPLPWVFPEAEFLVWAETMGLET